MIDSGGGLRVLVVYGSKTGCAGDIAGHIARTLAGAGVGVDLRAAEEAPDPTPYAAVVVGSGVRAGNWHAAVKKWVGTHADTLRARPTAFFTVGLTLVTAPERIEEVRGYTDPLIAKTGVTPVRLGLFTGCHESHRFGLLERLILKLIKAPVGDFRDFEAIAAWTRETAGALGLLPAPGTASSPGSPG